MSSEDKVSFTLRAVINKEETKVLFVQADSDFTDVLLSFLLLPLGTVVRLLKKHYKDETPIKGCLDTLRDGLVSLDVSNFGTEESKLMLLNPRTILGPDLGSRLKLNLNDSPPIKFFTCVKRDCWESGEVSLYFDTARCNCGESMNLEADLIKPAAEFAGVLTVENATFLISDDLKIFPNCMTSIQSLGIMDIDGTVQRTLTFGFSEIMDLLRGSLFSKTPFSDLIIDKSRRDSKPIAFVPQSTLQYWRSDMVLKAMIQKSTNKFLFAISEDDFVEFLFLSLALPLGQLDTQRKNSICNLFNSVWNVYRYLTGEGKFMLSLSKLPPMYKPSSGIASMVIEFSTTDFCFLTDNLNGEKAQFAYRFNSDSTLRRPYTAFKDPKSMGHYLKRKKMFMVTDDLRLTPSCVFSNLAELKKLGIPLSDVEEKELWIGSKEALNILKASFTTTCALTVGLSSLLKIQPKQEH